MILTYDNHIIMGDFNLNLNNLDDPNTELFIDTIKALGLQQDVKFLTHIGENILDAVIHKLRQA